tara:strand:+ start:9637 stop:10848 length:1212 start_codon:yes stop_codon:yes gene_type:complete
MSAKIPRKEFVALMALLMSLPALSIDSVLPALPLIKDQLHVDTDNHVQFIIGILFAGLTVGQLLFGSISDSFGRKPAIFIGLLIFAGGSILSLFSTSFSMMLMGRFLQGLGAASARVVCVAIARDLYEGRDMAQIMSFIMAVFVFVPAIAPTIGQGIILAFDWRAIFILYLVMAAIITIWMHKRLPETSPKEKRSPFALRTIKRDFSIVVRNKVTLGYTICAGLVFGGFISYLSSAQQIFLDFYHVGELFPLYFGLSALSIGLASWVNGMIVQRYGMERLSRYALIVIIAASSIFLLAFDLTDPNTPLAAYMTFAFVTFFCHGLLFGNLNTLAMEPMGQQAGTASAVIGSLSTAISVCIGTVIGQLYNHTLIPLVLGFLCLSAVTLILHMWLRHYTTKMDVAA